MLKFFLNKSVNTPTNKEFTKMFDKQLKTIPENKREKFANSEYRRITKEMKPVSQNVDKSDKRSK